MQNFKENSLDTVSNAKPKYSNLPNAIYWKDITRETRKDEL